MTQETDSKERKKRRRRLRAALLVFRRRLLRLCKQFHSAETTAEGWFGSINSYLGPILQTYPDLIPEGVRERIGEAIGFAQDAQHGVHRACELLNGEVDGLIKDLAEELGVEGKVRERLRPLTDPIAALLEASPLLKALAAAAGALIVGGSVVGAVAVASGGNGAPLRDPQGVTSTSHQVNIPSSDNTIDMTWQREPTAAAYSVQWSQQAQELPDTTVDLDGGATGVTSPALGAGSWYFHLRTQNSEGKWTSTVHAGPYVVLVAPPTPTPVPPTPTLTPVPVLVATATPAANRPPAVSPISAQFTQGAQTTIYRVTASDPEGAPLTLTWSGPNCGDSARPDERSFSWHHPHVVGDQASCAPTTDHSDVTITLRVSDGVNAVTCTYRGAASGAGAACQ